MGGEDMKIVGLCSQTRSRCRGRVRAPAAVARRRGGGTALALQCGMELLPLLVLLFMPLALTLAFRRARFGVLPGLATALVALGMIVFAPECRLPVSAAILTIAGGFVLGYGGLCAGIAAISRLGVVAAARVELPPATVVKLPPED